MFQIKCTCVHLNMLPVIQILQRRIILMTVNNETERMWQLVVVT
jgi:hypothetical protein